MRGRKMRLQMMVGAGVRAAFSHLFGTATGNPALDEHLAKTRAQLFLVLDHPELPLHNNAGELAVCRRVRTRAVIFGPRTRAGWNSFQTVAATAQKLGADIFRYLRDRVSAPIGCPAWTA